MAEGDEGGAARASLLTDIGANGFVRTLAVLFISALFLMVLAVASAQQQVISALDAAHSDDSFSVARRKVLDAQANRVERIQLQRDNRDIARENANLAGDVDEIEAAIRAQFNEIDVLSRQIVNSQRCPALNALIAREDRVLSGSIELWQEVLSCARAGNAPQNVLNGVLAIDVPDRNPILLMNRVKRANAKLQENQKQVDANSKRIEELSTQIAESTTVQNAFQDITLLEGNWAVQITGLAKMPPTIMQIFLCFLSGLFGALLLTLILIVYPNSQLKTAGSDSFWNRIFLGGLTAVGVFVMIGGGVAVISSNDTLFDGHANFMSFCAVGILAGMFSDRVASWFARQAVVFEAKDGALTGGGTMGTGAGGTGAEASTGAGTGMATASQPGTGTTPQT